MQGCQLFYDQRLYIQTKNGNTYTSFKERFSLGPAMIIAGPDGYISPRSGQDALDHCSAEFEAGECGRTRAI